MSLLLRNARPVDVAAGRSGGPVDVTVEDGCIAHVRPSIARRGRAARGAVLDVGGRWLVNSLVDAHVHLHGVGADAVAWPVDAALAAYRAAGVSLLRDLTPHPTPAPPALAGVRVVRAACASDPPASGGWRKAYGLPAAELQVTLQDARAAGTRVAAHLAPNSAAALVEDGAALPDSIEHVYTLFDYGFVSDAERDRAGVDVADRGIATWALAPASDHPTLGRLVARLGRERAFVVPTLAVMGGMLPTRQRNSFRASAPTGVVGWWGSRSRAFGWDRQLTEPQRRLRRAALVGLLRLTRCLATAGARIVLGTDFGEPFIAPGGGLHAELAWLARAGIGTDDLLRAAIQHPREMIGAPSGIEPGVPADLVVLDADPLKAPARLRSPWAVVAGGEVVHRS